jgi:putative hydrolase of the HAD superfamily
VVFDYGEVISLAPSESDRLALLAVAGIAVVDSHAAGAEAFWVSYWDHRAALDRGTLGVSDYWATIADEIGLTWRASDVQALWAADFRSWISVDPETVNLLAELGAGTTRMALLSNAGFDFGSAFRYFPIAEYFERIFVSAEMSALKPDAAIYLGVIEALGITAEQMVFIDNKIENTNAAAALGITVHHFTGADGLAEFLRSLAD